MLARRLLLLKEYAATELGRYDRAKIGPRVSRDQSQNQEAFSLPPHGRVGYL